MFSDFIALQTQPYRQSQGLFSRARLRWFVFVSLIVSTASLRAAVDYSQTIKPMLRDRCCSCHGALKQKAQLRLDTVALMFKGGKSGTAIERGKPETSRLITRITESDLDKRMPPEHEGEPFTAAQIALLREWITAGAPAPSDEKAESDPKDHWSFRPRVRPRVPVVANASWVRNPIDAFLSKQHEALGLKPQPEASRAILLRRLQLDLIGLLPTPEEITAFENDASPEWYEHAVKRLLDDPRHGERWARHWMDIWRYSDWWGLGEQLRNSQKHIWHWRDWIVESLNADTPYDEMIRLMLAADESNPTDLSKLRATGFLARNWFIFNRDHWMDETVEHVSKAFLGITMNCAKCHDHKFDPFAQTDYYRMRAFFEPYQVRMDMLPGQGDLTRDGIPRIYDGRIDTPTYLFTRGDEAKPDKSAVIAPGVPALLSFKKLDIHSIALPQDAWQPERQPWVLDNHLAAATKGVDEATQKLSITKGDKHLAELTLTLANAELASVEARCAAMRAAWSNQETAQDAAAAAIHAEREVAIAKAQHSIADAELRLKKAGAKKAAVERELKTARDTFDKATKALAAPIAATDKFTPLPGAAWTPTRFLNSTKDDPAVEFSAQSSGRRSALAGWITDARNPLTARVAINHLWSRHMGTPLAPNTFEFGRKSPVPANPELIDWLASELVENGWSMKHLHQLIVTSAAYRMSSSSVDAEANITKDTDNLHWWRRTPVRIEGQAVRDSILALAGQLDPMMGGPTVDPSKQDDSKRRSLYFFHSNNDRNAFLTTFDEASVKECYRRDQSIVPQQALALSNSRLVHDCASLIARQINASDDTGFVRQAFRTLLGELPNAVELSACTDTLQAWRKLPDTTPDQARSHLIWVLFNHNDFVTLR